jgi:5-dehydro-4-deoxyglucarate dehydratase
MRAYPIQWDILSSQRIEHVTPAREVLKRRISEGILAFPATPFDERGALVELARHRPCAIVAAGGAGELFSLSLAEHEVLIRSAVAATPEIPVVAGVGFGVAIACDMARSAEESGAAAVLLFPPYLVGSEQEGLAAYVEAVCRSTSLAVIVYSRGNGVLAPSTALRLAETCPNLIALKDGTGDFEALTILKQQAGDRLVLINGVPTAEMIVPQCFAIGIRSYTSAVFTFLPGLATRYFQAVRDNDRDTFERILRDFYVPLSAIRSRKKGYAVSIMKAGLRIVGRSAGRVRPPLVDLSAGEEAELAALIERILAEASEAPRYGASAAGASG